MNISVHPEGDMVLVQRITEKLEMYKNLLYIPEIAQSIQRFGVVEAVGPDVKSTRIVPGAVVYLWGQAGMPLDLSGIAGIDGGMASHVLVEERQISCTITGIDAERYTPLALGEYVRLLAPVQGHASGEILSVQEINGDTLVVSDGYSDPVAVSARDIEPTRRDRLAATVGQRRLTGGE